MSEELLFAENWLSRTASGYPVGEGCALQAEIVLDEYDRMRAECNALRAALDLELSRRTLGGTPPPPDRNWANQALPPPQSATTGPTAPPGMARSDDHLR